MLFNKLMNDDIYLKLEFISKFKIKIKSDIDFFKIFDKL